MRLKLGPSSQKYKLNDTSQEFFKDFGELEFFALSSDKEEYLVCGGKSNKHEVCIYEPNFGIPCHSMKYISRINPGYFTSFKTSRDGRFAAAYENGTVVRGTFEMASWSQTGAVRMLKAGVTHLVSRRTPYN